MAFKIGQELTSVPKFLRDCFCPYEQFPFCGFQLRKKLVKSIICYFLPTPLRKMEEMTEKYNFAKKFYKESKHLSESSVSYLVL